MNSCTFCEEIVNKESNLFYNTVGKKLGIKDRVLFEDDDWLVIPTLGCFVVGYLLIVSKYHHLAIASLPDSLYPGLERLINKISGIIKKQFGMPIIAFEHGSVVGQYRLSCCVDHMHLHIIPYGKDCWQEIVDDYNLSVQKMSSFSNVKSFVKQNNIKSYLLFQNIDTQISIIDGTTVIFPSQFFRKIFSKKIDDAINWDWRSFYYEENILKTIDLGNKYLWFK
jgi:diadenosine tetraphosphate (Ap4A) HIT family hydrolase